jgi:hypothetical protein
MKKVYMVKSMSLQAAKFFAFNLSLLMLFGTALLGCHGKEDTNGNDTKGFSITQTDYTFTSANEGYVEATSTTVSVKNEESTAITVTIALSGANSDSFSLSAASLDLPANDSKTFTVSHKKGLRENTYTATVTISAAGYESKSFKVSFTVDPPKDEKHLYIAFGQSNMQGPGEAQAQDQNGVPERFKVLNVVGATYAYGNTVVSNITPNGGKRTKGEWYKAVPPNIVNGTNPTGSSGTKVGLSPVDYFGRTVVDGTPESIEIGIVAVAFGDLALSSFRKYAGAGYYSGTGNGGTVTFTDRDGQPKNVTRAASRPSGTERQGWRRITTNTENVNGEACTAGYESFYDAIVTNVKLAQSQGYVVKGIIFHQGESGRGLEDKTWVEILKEIYDDILEDIELEANSIPILCGQQFGGNGATSSGNTGDSGILNTDNHIKDTIPNAWVIDSTGLANRGDNIHFSTQGIRDLGARFGQKMLEVVYGYTE